MTILRLPGVESETWTLDDLNRLPSDMRCEVHDGKLVVMPHPILWHQDIETRVCLFLRQAGRLAYTQVGIRRTDTDGRVPDVAVFYDKPDLSMQWHDPASFALVTEVWSPGSDEKDTKPQWYADRCIPEYWLATPIKGYEADAMIAMHVLDGSEYRVTGRVALSVLEQRGLASS